MLAYIVELNFFLLNKEKQSASGIILYSSCFSYSLWSNFKFCFRWHKKNTVNVFLPVRTISDPPLFIHTTSEIFVTTIVHLLAVTNICLALFFITYNSRYKFCKRYDYWKEPP